MRRNGQRITKDAFTSSNDMDYSRVFDIAWTDLVRNADVCYVSGKSVITVVIRQGLLRLIDHIARFPDCQICSSFGL